MHDNQFAAGMLLTTLLAGSLAYLRNVPTYLVQLFWRQFSVTVEVRSIDTAFQWINIWLDEHPYSKYARNIAASTYYPRDREAEDFDYDSFAGNGPVTRRNRPRILFTPAKGEHLLWYHGRPLWLSRTRAAQEPNGRGSTGTSVERESITISVLGRDQAPIRALLYDAMQLAMPAEQPETVIIASAEGRWGTPVRRKPRTSSTVILEVGVLDKLINDAKVFLTRKEWYENLNIPYRRGYLLYGVPGSGKTSAVLAVAGELNLDVYLLNLGDRQLDDSRVNYLLGQVPAGNIILLEDIDAAFAGRKLTTAEESQSQVTFSGLLNAIDGVASRDGRLLFMTTNHREKLDAALIRPGRADVHVLFDNASPYQAMQMFRRFYDNPDNKLIEEFGRITPPNKLSMAAIQDHLLSHQDCPQDAIDTWLTRVNSDT